MDKKQARIDELLNYQTRVYEVFQQKAELLLRNKKFLEDMEKARVSSKKKQQAALSRWFYAKWDIGSNWNGDKSTLWYPSYIRAGARLCSMPAIKHIKENSSSEEIREALRPQFMPGNQPYIWIQIDPWTTGKQIQELLLRLNEYKKNVFGFSLESKSNFARDLCWYDLHNEMKLGTSEIARLWASKRQKEFLELVGKSPGWKNGEKKGPELTVELAGGEFRRYLEDYIKQGLPSVVRSGINRIKMAIEYLNR